MSNNLKSLRLLIKGYTNRTKGSVCFLFFFWFWFFLLLSAPTYHRYNMVDPAGNGLNNYRSSLNRGIDTDDDGGGGGRSGAIMRRVLPRRTVTDDDKGANQVICHHGPTKLERCDKSSAYDCTRQKIKGGSISAAMPEYQATFHSSYTPSSNAKAANARPGTSKEELCTDVVPKPDCCINRSDEQRVVPNQLLGVPSRPVLARSKTSAMNRASSSWPPQVVTITRAQSLAPCKVSHGTIRPGAVAVEGPGLDNHNSQTIQLADDEEYPSSRTITNNSPPSTLGSHTRNTPNLTGQSTGMEQDMPIAAHVIEEVDIEEQVEERVQKEKVLLQRLISEQLLLKAQSSSALAVAVPEHERQHDEERSSKESRKESTRRCWWKLTILLAITVLAAGGVCVGLLYLSNRWPGNKSSHVPPERNGTTSNDTTDANSSRTRYPAPTVATEAPKTPTKKPIPTLAPPEQSISTMAPTSSPTVSLIFYTSLLTKLKPVLPQKPEEGSFEAMALNWIAFEDPMRAAVITYKQWLVIERYVIVLLYFSTGGAAWTRNYNFLSNSSICQWGDSGTQQGIFCDEYGNAVAISLGTKRSFVVIRSQ